MAALLKSREYTRGFFWSIFLLSLIALICSLFIDAALRPLDMLPLGSLAHSVANIFISLMETIYFYLVFNHLRAIKGDSLPAPSSAQKNIFLTVGAIGIILAIIVAGLAIYFAPEIKNELNKEIIKIQSQQNHELPVPASQKAI